MWKPLWIVGDKINPIRNRSERWVMRSGPDPYDVQH
jgi:hypothetical protein